MLYICVGVEQACTCVWGATVVLEGGLLDPGSLEFRYQEYSVMASEKGPTRLNMKFSESGRKVVIHLVRGLPPKISTDKKTITITFPEQRATRSHLPAAIVEKP
jgi:hypothetical protein